MSSSAGSAAYQRIMRGVNESESAREFSAFLVKSNELLASCGRDTLLRTLSQCENAIQDDERRDAVESLAKAVKSSKADLGVAIIGWGRQYN